MPTPRAEPQHVVLLLVAAVAAAAAALAAGPDGVAQSLRVRSGPQSWRGLVGSRPPVSLGRRMIVVLRTPSLAENVARDPGATPADERAWSAAAHDAQQLLVSRLVAQGIPVRPELSFTRALDGFSAALDASDVPAVERDPDVAGVYPVRAAYPATLSASPAMQLSQRRAASGLDGRGVRVALLDTGVDSTVPSLRGHVQRGIDVLGGDPDALAAVSPDDPAEIERHGTEMAGLVAGVAPGASLLPVRVAGWQPDALGHFAVYARSDQLLAGLDRAVDPNGDGDAYDAARIALVALAEPFAAFADGPEARAAAGALALGTLVVAPAGNDGTAGAGYGDVAGPAAAATALAVGAIDARATTTRVRVVVRAGLRTLLDTTQSLAGGVAPAHRLELAVAVPRAAGITGYFSVGGTALVAGRAALVAAGSSPAPAAGRAAAAGAAAVLLYGGAGLPPGGLSLGVPVVSVPRAVADAIARGQTATVALEPAGSERNVVRGRVASFSSRGLAFDGRVKPDVLAPGVGLLTVDPGTNADGSPRFVTVSGTSAAAATAAGEAALVAQARPRLRGSDLRAALIVGRVRREPIALEPVSLLANVRLSERSFAASDTRPALLTLDAGRVLRKDGATGVRPVARLDVELLAGGTTVGVLARLRDVLPGRYTFGLTGRGPDGALLAAGSYAVRLLAYPVDGGAPTRRTLRFVLR